MGEIINKRSELLFCYDIKDANPNGDPLDSNKPRIDEDTMLNLVTDVRLKKTAKEYFFEYKGHNGGQDKDIFVRETKTDTGIKDGKKRAEDFGKNSETIINKCIDIRLFGGVLPLEGDSITFTGPVQFQMGRSLHKIDIKQIKGTGAFASGENKKNATFREEYILPYSFISFHGIINENAAKYTKLTDEDVTLLMEGIWEGTKNLISRSKFGQMPRLLIKVNYTKPGFHIGDLNKMISIISDKKDEELRDVSDFKLDITRLKNTLEKYNDKIESIEYLIDERLQTIYNGSEYDFTGLLADKMKRMEF